MLTITSTQLSIWIASFIWPLTRILGFFALAPIFGNESVPQSAKVGLGVALAVLIAPTLPPVPLVDPLTLQGIAILAQQMVIGLAMGFAMRLIFAGIELAGELIGLTMGLGFATFFDPQSHGRTSIINQMLSLLAMLVFLAANFHLMVITAMFESFTSMPIGASILGSAGSSQIAAWAGNIFLFGLKISLPIVAALLVTNVALGILTRAAPQLNLFGVGFSITLSVGIIMTGLTLPYMGTHFIHAFEQGLNEMHIITTPAYPILKKHSWTPS
jgi:flagellar biosynthetic protein FliR